MGPIDEAMRVELGVVGDSGKLQNPVVMSGLRDIKVFIEAAKGNLLFTTEVKDWSVELPTAGVKGKSTVQVRVLDGLIGEEEKPLSKEALKPLSASEKQWAKLEIQNKKLLATVVIDDSKPEEVRFVDPPKEWASSKSRSF